MDPRKPDKGDDTHPSGTLRIVQVRAVNAVTRLSQNDDWSDPWTGVLRAPCGMVGATPILRAERVRLAVRSMRHQVRSIQHSVLQVGLAVPVGRAEAWGLASSRAAMTCLTPCRRISHPRTSRDAGPYLRAERERLGVSGWRFNDAASGTIDSALRALHSTQHSVLQVGLTVLGRPRGGMGSGFVSRSDDVPDPVPTYLTSSDQQGRWSLPTRGARAVGG